MLKHTPVRLAATFTALFASTFVVLFAVLFAGNAPKLALTSSGFGWAAFLLAVVLG